MALLHSCKGRECVPVKAIVGQHRYTWQGLPRATDKYQNRVISSFLHWKHQVKEQLSLLLSCKLMVRCCFTFRYFMGDFLSRYSCEECLKAWLSWWTLFIVCFCFFVYYTIDWFWLFIIKYNAYIWQFPFRIWKVVCTFIIFVLIRWWYHLVLVFLYT